MTSTVFVSTFWVQGDIANDVVAAVNLTEKGAKEAILELAKEFCDETPTWEEFVNHVNLGEFGYNLHPVPMGE